MLLINMTMLLLEWDRPRLAMALLKELHGAIVGAAEAAPPETHRDTLLVSERFQGIVAGGRPARWTSFPALASPSSRKRSDTVGEFTGLIGSGVLAVDRFASESLSGSLKPA
jgi:hypothetical protein